MRVCLRGACKQTGKENNVCCLECSKTDACKELGRCTVDTPNIDLNKCSVIKYSCCRKDVKI